MIKRPSHVEAVLVDGIRDDVSNDVVADRSELGSVVSDCCCIHETVKDSLS